MKHPASPPILSKMSQIARSLLALPLRSSPCYVAVRQGVEFSQLVAYSDDARQASCKYCDRNLGIQFKLRGKLYSKVKDMIGNNTEQRVPLDIRGKNLL